jgi:hypothetical protein
MLATMPFVGAGLAAAPAGDPTLVGWWKLDDGAGSLAADASGNGNNGTITGASWVAGHIGGALSFNGSSNVVSMGKPAALNLTHVGTIACWVKYDNTTAAGSSKWPMILGNGDWDADVNGYLFALNSEAGNEGQVIFEILNGSGGVFVVSTAKYGNSAWHHLCGTWNGSALTLYVDGVSVGTTPQTADAVSGANPFVIGRNAAAADGFFAGSVDDVRVYNRALSATEVAALAAM